KVEISSHNHGFAVDAPIGEEFLAPHDDGRYGRVVVSHVGLNDQVVEGLRCLDIPAFSVQYHPEAAAGPHDAAYLFDRFVALITDRTSHRCPAAPTSPASSSSGPARSSSGRPPSSTTRAPRPAGCCARRACVSSSSTSTRRRS